MGGSCALGVLHNARDGGDHFLELGVFNAELFTAGASEGVEAGAAVGVSDSPLGFDPALEKKALEGGVQGAFFDGEDVAGDVFEGEGDAIAVEGGAGEGFKDEHV